MPSHKTSLPLRARICALLLLLSWCHFASAAQAARPAQHGIVKYKTNLPPPADLSYSIRARQKGMDINGNALVHWSWGGGRYSIAAETRAMLVGRILEERSEGAIDEFGLAPVAFTEKRFRKEATTATFNRQTRTISFSESAQTYPIKGGEQDRVSVVWQLAAVARAAPSKFHVGSAWNFFVVGQEDADAWTFRVTGQEKVSTGQGEVNALRVLRDAGPDAKGRRVEVWLAPALEWYPVRLRYSEPGGEYIEQTLESIARK